MRETIIVKCANLRFRGDNANKGIVKFRSGVI